jgi:hypothetical protein
MVTSPSLLITKPRDVHAFSPSPILNLITRRSIISLRDMHLWCNALIGWCLQLMNQEASAIRKTTEKTSESWVGMRSATGTYGLSVWYHLHRCRWPNVRINACAVRYSPDISKQWYCREHTYSSLSHDSFSKLLKPSGTTSLTFTNSTFCPHSVFMCFVWIWEQTAIISLYNID